MTATAKTELDAFGRAYRHQILYAVWQAIIDISYDERILRMSQGAELRCSQ